MQSKGVIKIKLNLANNSKHTTDFFLDEFNMSPEHSQVGGLIRIDNKPFNNNKSRLSKQFMELSISLMLVSSIPGWGQGTFQTCTTNGSLTMPLMTINVVEISALVLVSQMLMQNWSPMEIQKENPENRLVYCLCHSIKTTFPSFDMILNFIRMESKLHVSLEYY